MHSRAKVKEIIALIKEAPSEAIRLDLVELLLTPTELSQLVARYEIVKSLVRARETQREIAEKLKLSIAKITRGSNELKRCEAQALAYLGEFFK